MAQTNHELSSIAGCDESTKTSSEQQTATAPMQEEAAAIPPEDEALYSDFTSRQRSVIVYMVSLAAIISPFSGTLYYPALPILAEDYRVSQTLIQLTVTVYQIFQGIAPSFIANYSDSYGRKPAYLICFLILLVANIALALQNSYAALIVLRCLQSTGSSVTVPLGAGTVAELTTRAERGKFIALASLGTTLGPALGPIIGGLLTKYLGWRAIFWFLAIFAGVLLPVYVLLVPETARSVVGNGSIPPSRWLMTPSRHRQHKRLDSRSHSQHAKERKALKAKRSSWDPLAASKILREREGGMALGYGALIFGGYFMVLTTLPTELNKRFGFNEVEIGLCYLPIFVGSAFSRSTAGWLLDRNYKRHAKRCELEIVKSKQSAQDHEKMSIEAARLQVSIPMIYATALCVIAYGWTLQKTSSLAGIEVTLFFVGLFNNGALTGLNTLVVDTHPESPATAMAASNLFRCLVSAGATALAVPLIDKIGIGWTSVFIAGVWLVFSPFLWLVLLYGERWRREKQSKLNDAHGPDEERKDGSAATLGKMRHHNRTNQAA